VNRLKKYQLAAETLAIWENDVRRFAPDEHLRWQQLLALLSDDIPPEDLLAALAPLAAKNDKQQKQFAEIFKQAQATIAAAGAKDSDRDLTGIEALPDQETASPGKPFLGKWKFWAAVFSIIFLGLILWRFSGKSNKEINLPKRVPFNIAANSSQTVCTDSLELENWGKISTIVFAENNNDSLPTDFGLWVIQPGGCVRYFAADTPGQDSVRIVISATGKTMNLSSTIPVDFIANVVKLISKNAESAAYLFEAHDTPFSYHDELILGLRITPPDAFSNFLGKYANWLKTIGLLLLAAILYGFVYWLALRRRRLIAGREKSIKPPYIWNLQFPDLPAPDPGDTLAPALNAMRRRTEDDVFLLDVPASVRASIRKGGMATFQFRQQTKPPEYLLLIDRHDARDHRARLYDDLYANFRKNDVLVERFFFFGDLSVCQNEVYPDGLRLEELLFKFPTSRLLIISHGRQLFNPTTGKLAKWTERFTQWKDRALLTPLPASDWGRRERQLADLFSLAPASLEGIRLMLDAFDADEDARLPDFEKLASLAVQDTVHLEGSLLETLEQHFPDEKIRIWIATCAIWPELHYDLTLWLGHWLSQELGATPCSLDRMTDLMRLPWFTAGQIPGEARAELLQWLREKHYQLFYNVSLALHELLARPENRPPEDSAAWDAFAMRVAFNEWRGAINPERKKQLEEEIARLIDSGVEPDFVAVRELDHAPTADGIEFLLPEIWKKRLYKGGFRALGLRQTARNAVWAGFVWIAAAIGLMFWQPNVPECPGEKAQLAIGKDTINVCANTDADLLLLWEFRMRVAAGTDDSLAFDSLQNRYPVNPDLPGLASFSRECLANISNAAYNTGVLYYQTSDILGFLDPQNGNPKLDACRWFWRAARVEKDSASLAWVRRAEAWCGNDIIEAARPEIRPNIIGIVRDSSTGRVLPGVRVTGSTINIETDDNGRFTLRLSSRYQEPGITLRFAMKDYKSFTRRFNIEATDTLPSIRLARITQSGDTVSSVISSKNEQPPNTGGRSGIQPTRSPSSTESGEIPPPSRDEINAQPSDFTFEDKPQNALQLTIYVQGLDGKPVTDLQNKGKLIVDIGNNRRNNLLIGESGRTNLGEIPENMRGKKIYILLEAESYEAVEPSKQYILDGKPIYFLVQPAKSIGIIQGIVKDQKSEKFIQGASVMIANAVPAITDNFGRFRIQLPEAKPGVEYEIRIQKKGYKTMNYTYILSTAKNSVIEVRLERN
jgi:hypothetical protein